jgi:hypothetical protein
MTASTSFEGSAVLVSDVLLTTVISELLHLMAASIFLKVRVVFGSCINIVLWLFSKNWRPAVRAFLEDEVNREGSQTSKDANGPLKAGKSIDMNTECVSNLPVDWPRVHDEDLEACDGRQDSEEHRVGGDTLEEVDLVIDLSSAEHVEDLQPDEHVEHNGQVS